MQLHFHKYQGTGNDFILIDDRREQFDPRRQDLVARLCHRRFGIGADGLILLRNAADADFEMVYFNADGRPSTLCGNGGRCIVRFAHKLGLFDTHTTFRAADGLHSAFLEGGVIHLHMQDVRDIQTGQGYHFVHTGSPHHVQFVRQLEDFPVFEEGKKIRHHERYRQIGGTNANFVEVLAEPFSLFVRTFERGVEDETYSCGTGVTAAALAAFPQAASATIEVRTLGGELAVSFVRSGGLYHDIYLIGPAQEVFEGDIAVPDPADARIHWA